MSKEKTIVINNNYDTTAVTTQNNEVRQALRTISQQLEQLPATLADAITALLQQHDPKNGLARTSLFGMPVPKTYRNPTDLEYTALRDWVHGFVDWLRDRWAVPYRAVWRILYNDLSDAIGQNILDGFKVFTRIHGKSHTCLDMCDVYGYLRTFSITAYNNYGRGQSLPDHRYETAVTTPLKLEPIGERAGALVSALLSKNLQTKRAGRTRKPAQESSVVEEVSAKVEEFKVTKQKAQIMPEQDVLSEEPAPQVVAQIADVAEAALKELVTTTKLQAAEEPWTQINQ